MMTESFFDQYTKGTFQWYWPPCKQAYPFVLPSLGFCVQAVHEAWHTLLKGVQGVMLGVVAREVVSQTTQGFPHQLQLLTLWHQMTTAISGNMLGMLWRKRNLRVHCAGILEESSCNHLHSWMTVTHLTIWEYNNTRSWSNFVLYNVVPNAFILATNGVNGGYFFVKIHICLALNLTGECRDHANSIQGEDLSQDLNTEPQNCDAVLVATTSLFISLKYPCRVLFMALPDCG